MAVTKHRVARKFGFMYRRFPAIHHQVVHAVAGNTSAFKKRRHQKVRIECTQLRCDHVGLHRIVTAQRRVRTADQNRIDVMAALFQLGQCQLQVYADLAGNVRSRLGSHTASIGQHKKQR
jgi:hypothetical protein